MVVADGCGGVAVCSLPRLLLASNVRRAGGARFSLYSPLLASSLPLFSSLLSPLLSPLSSLLSSLVSPSLLISPHMAGGCNRCFAHRVHSLLSLSSLSLLSLAALLFTYLSSLLFPLASSLPFPLGYARTKLTKRRRECSADSSLWCRRWSYIAMGMGPRTQRDGMQGRADRGCVISLAPQVELHLQWGWRRRRLGLLTARRPSPPPTPQLPRRLLLLLLPRAHRPGPHLAIKHGLSVHSPVDVCDTCG